MRTTITVTADGAATGTASDPAAPGTGPSGPATDGGAAPERLWRTAGTTTSSAGPPAADDPSDAGPAPMS